MSLQRPSASHLLFVARGEARLALAAARRGMRSALLILGWATLAILAGCVVGLSAIVLPPMGLVGIIAVFALILLWVLPEGFRPPDRLIRQLVFAVVFVDLSLPTYYTIQILGLPWISARRIVTFLLIILFGFAYSSSRAARSRIAEVARDSRLLFICVGGYLVMIFLSMFTSLAPLTSLNGLVDAILEWFIPFVVVIYAIRSDEDVSRLIRLICCCAILVSIIGLWDFHAYTRHYILWMPKWLVAELSKNNWTFAALATSLELRSGIYRPSSVFASALSFAEFEGMVSPFALMYLVHGRSVSDRIFGGVLLAACLAGIYVSGSRGGYLSFLAASFVLTFLFVARSGYITPRSLMTPVFGSLAAAGATVVMFMIFFVGKIRSAVIGGGETQASNAARVEQWRLAMPKIIANPITGHGFDQSGVAIGYIEPNGTWSVDSFLLTLIVETGVPSVIFFFGTALIGAWFAGQRYVRDQSWAGALAGALAASITAFAAYRFFLSQRENMTLFYVMTACVAVLHHLRLGADGRKAEPGPAVRADAPARSDRSPVRRPAPAAAPAAMPRKRP